jgi:hypothetical protein
MSSKKRSRRLPLQGLIRCAPLTAVALLSPDVRGQEAIRVGWDQERSYLQRNGPTAFKDGAHHAGPVTYDVVATYGLEWRDNVLTTQTNRLSDFIHRPQIDFRIQWQVSQDSSLHAGVGLGYYKYDRYTSNDRFFIAPNSEIAWDLRMKDLLVTLYDEAKYAQDVISQSTLTGVSSFPRLDNTVGVRASWTPGAYLAEFLYGHETFSARSSQFTYLNHSAEHLVGRLGYFVAPQSSVGVETSGSFTSYSQQIQQDNNSFSIGPYVDLQLTHAIRLNLRGGYVDYSLDPGPVAGPGSNLDGYYAHAEINHALTEHIVHSLIFNREIQQALTLGSRYLDTRRADYQISWSATRYLTATSSFFYENGKEAQIVQTETFIRRGASAGLSYQLTSHIAPTLQYTFANRSSNLPNRNYYVNSVTVGLSWRF